MSDIPKIAYDRLRTAAPAGPHPDADVLAAFAEQKLSATEREGVLQHIARCSDCREVVALGLPPSETVAELDGAREEANAVPVLRSRSARNWFAWPNLRWAGLAAAMVVVASVLMLRPGKERKATFATLNKQVETSAPAAASNQLAATAPRPAESPAAEKSALPVLAQSAKPDNSVPRARPELRMMEPLNGSMPAQAPPAEVGTLAGNKRSDAVGDTRLYSLEAGKQELKTPKASAGVARDEIVAREQVEVSAAQPAVSTEADAMSQAAPAQDKLMARGNAPPPIEKAKPAA